MRFAQWVFRIAGVYGVLTLLPFYFLEDRIAMDSPPAITHPEYFYGFLGVGLAWQAAFLVIAQDPMRFRPLMIPAFLEKATFGVAAWILFAKGRVPAVIAGFGTVDLTLGLLFLWAAAILRPTADPRGADSA